MKIILTVFFVFKIIQSCYTLSCIKCDSSQHERCHFLQPIDSATQCVGGLPEGTEDRCFIQFTEMGVTIRGCLSENPHLLEVCEHGTGNCRICFEDQCNIDQTIRENCAICDSTADPNCASAPASFVQMCPFVYEYDAGGCYLHKRSDGGVQRGCMVTATTDFIDLCREGKECKICRGQICNTKVDFQECHICDSEVDEDLACLSNPANSPTKICHDYGDSCVQLVIPNGKTVRGCLQDLDESISTLCPSNNCQICFDNNCNSNIFPSDRLLCHQCNDAEDCHKDMTSIDKVAYPCRNYALDDQCYTVREGSVVYRGCLSDRTLEKATCDAAGDLCYKCSEQGCNSEAIEIPPEPTERIWCHQCRGNSTSDCAYYQPWTNSAPCTAELKPGEREKCFVGRYALDTVRGCTGDDFPDLFGNKFCDVLECLVCNDWHCNFHSRAEQQCVQCSSSIDDGDYREECLNEPEKVYPWYCPVNDYFSIEDKGCYSMRLETFVNGKSHSYVKRGCKYNMEHNSRCYDDADKSCIICEGDGCNTHDVGFGTKLYATGAILIFNIILLHFLV